MARERWRGRYGIGGSVDRYAGWEVGLGFIEVGQVYSIVCICQFPSIIMSMIEHDQKHNNGRVL